MEPFLRGDAQNCIGPIETTVLSNFIRRPKTFAEKVERADEAHRSKRLSVCGENSSLGK